MGIYDRDYMSGQGSRPGLGIGRVPLGLLMVNALAFIVEISGVPLAEWMRLEFSRLISGEPWRLITFQFCHVRPAHFLLNMMALLVVAGIGRRVFSEMQLLGLYLFGGGAGGLFHILWGLPREPAFLMGASASILAIFCALAVQLPRGKVELFLIPFRFSLRQLGWLALGVNIAGLMVSKWVMKSEISYSSHLGGMAAGWLFAAVILPSRERRRSRAENRRKARSTTVSQPAGSAPEPLPALPFRAIQGAAAEPLERQIDAILEKISAQGIKSLTSEERKILKRGSEKLAKKLNNSDQM